MVVSRGSIPAAYEPALSTQAIIIHPTATLSVTFLAYGTYLALFLTSLFILARKRRGLCSSTRSRYNPKAHLTQIILLFVVITIADGVYVVETARSMLVSFDVFKNASYDDYMERMRGGGARVVLQIVFVVSIVMLNAIVDFILVSEPTLPIHENINPVILQISRCYSIWNNSKRVAIPLIVVSGLINLIGIATAPLYGLDSSSWPQVSRWNEKGATPLILTFFCSSLIFNLVLTLLTAGRIWWIGREVGLLLGSAVHKKYNTVIAMILESGIIYPLAQLLGLVFTFAYQNTRKFPFNPLPIVVTAAGIAPTLLTVRVALGQSVENVDSMVVEESLKFGEGNRVRSVNDSSVPMTSTLTDEERSIAASSSSRMSRDVENGSWES
ncbi:hypothetical protein PM082_019972 [Marasmius tenuissimus]|nr:hypothetical protein PM082_019972 [Marasmius tenuissimus]